MFIEQTLHFIEGSDLEISWPDIRKVQVDSNGRRAINLSFSSSFSVNKLKENHLLSVMVVFGLFDALIDISYPNLEGDSFKRRYEQFPTSNSREITFKETYRDLKLLRNAAIHNKSSLNIGEHGVELSYINRGTLFELKCTKKALVLLNTLVVLLVRSKDLQNEYTTQYIYSYFNDMVSEFSSMSDEFGRSLIPVLNTLNLKTSVRYRVTNVNLNFCDATNVYNLELQRAPDNEPWASDEYVLKIDGVEYLVPGEAIGDDGFLTKSELSRWVKHVGCIFL